MHQAIMPACSQTNGVDCSPEPEAKKKACGLGRTVATIANVCRQVGRAIMYTIKSLLKFPIYVSITPYKYIFNCPAYPFTRLKTTPYLRQGPAQKLPQLVDELEHKAVTDPQRVQGKLGKELCAAERQLTHCPKAFAGDPNAANYYRQAPGITFPADKNLTPVTRTRTFPERTTIHYEPISGTQTGIAYAQGARPSMEDAHIADRFTIMINNKPVEIDITAIFDGHAGSGWSQYASQHIIRHLKQNIEKWNSDGLNDTGIWNALKHAPVDLDNEGPLIPPGQPADPFIHELRKSGTTANIVLRINGDLWVINLGDSRAILIDNNGQIRQISEDAEPDDPRYRRSIEKRGGNVVVGKYGIPRVNRQLAVARSLGDHYFNGAISARGKVTKIPASECSQGTLIQVCDGITEAAFSEDIARTVQHQLDQGKPVHVAAAMPLAKAYQAGSGDNMSVMVTQL